MFLKCLIFLVVLHFSHQKRNSSYTLYDEPSQDKDPKIYYMKISTKVENRYATTLITSRIKNPCVVGKEANFFVYLPEKAFVSKFVMENNNRIYESEVKSKEEAQSIYDQAKQKGQSSAQVTVNARDSKRFSINIFLEAEGRAVFYLTYEELLTKRAGKYGLVLNIYPGQLVDNLQMEVMINESVPIKFIKTPVFRPSGRLDVKKVVKAKIEMQGTSAYIRYNPDLEEQRVIAENFGNEEKFGLAAQFVVEYDVGEVSTGGQIIQTKKYFTHFFSPPNSSVLPKYVAFVLDTSSSMNGLKLNQLKDAMLQILSKLNSNDYFNIVEFSDIARVWDVNQVDITYREGDVYNDNENNVLPDAHPVNRRNIERARQIINLLDAFQMTNIYSALKVALQLVEKNKIQAENTQPIIMFLTDGESTTGETNSQKIIKLITFQNSKRTPIYTLSVGEDYNRNFIETLALKNLATTKHIYEANGISKQLQTFFDDICEPSLKNIDFKYGPKIHDTSLTKFPLGFAGEELIVVGKKQENVDLSNLDDIKVKAKKINESINLVPDVEHSTVSMERLWAFINVKQLLKQRKIMDDNEAITKKALKLSLKYSFVTELTSLVVVQQEKNSVIKINGNFESEEIGTTRRPPSRGVPVTVSTPTNVRGVTGNNIVIPCAAEGNPSPVVEWFKDQTLLYPSPAIEILPDYTLRVLNATPSDSGIYKCKASNDFSMASDETQVTIEGVYVPPNCIDEPFLANCKLIVKAKFCDHKFYSKHCCRSCTLAGQLQPSKPAYDVEVKSKAVTLWLEPVQQLAKVRQNILWLKDKLMEDGTLDLEDLGIFNLNIDKGRYISDRCSLEIDEKMEFGFCLRLAQCPGVYPNLTIFFLQALMCNLEGKYGICCFDKFINN